MHVIRIASDLHPAPKGSKERIQKALFSLRGAHPCAKGPICNIVATPKSGPFTFADVTDFARQMEELNHRWHEKYLVVDGKAAVLGGMNMADEYLRGGSGALIDVLGEKRPAWRDTDVLVTGPAAARAHASFAREWKAISNEDVPVAKAPPATGSATLQILQHRPRDAGDHYVANVMIESLKALEKGQRAVIANAYFLPTGGLRAYKTALMEAARRGVDVRVVTNSADTSDLPDINHVAVFPYRELLAAGVRVFERSGSRTMHTKAAAFGGAIGMVGSWNADNRSESLNSEALAVVHDPAFASELEAVLLKDMAEDVAREVKLETVSSLPAKTEIDAYLRSIMSDLM